MSSPPASLSSRLLFPRAQNLTLRCGIRRTSFSLSVPLSLHLTLKDPAKWDGVPLSHPDMFVLELTCASKAVVDPSYPYCASSAAENNKYSVRYEGARMRSPAGKELSLDPTAKRGIIIDTLWFRTFADDAPRTTPEANSNKGRRGWEMQFFVPIATRLFDKRETRAFTVEGLVSVGGEQLATRPGAATMSVSHLMREREMVVRR
ncbi:hypothetical protein MVEN_02221700 [Mycena venus]|uniref:Uncharacterized protein n=1 Tax=Mycena venus TaxID=2733690 RepID=A0A8H7CH12_9AGAR|nr:hypothetical protein MVEN_02221700 [Mycena venus]